MVKYLVIAQDVFYSKEKKPIKLYPCTPRMGVFDRYSKAKKRFNELKKELPENAEVSDYVSGSFKCVEYFCANFDHNGYPSMRSIHIMEIASEDDEDWTDLL